MRKKKDFKNFDRQKFNIPSVQNDWTYTLGCGLVEDEPEEIEYYIYDHIVSQLNVPAFTEEYGDTIIENLIGRFEDEARRILRCYNVKTDPAYITKISGLVSINPETPKSRMPLLDKPPENWNERIESAIRVLLSAGRVRDAIKENNPETAAIEMMFLTSSLIRASMTEVIKAGYMDIARRKKGKPKPKIAIVAAIHRILDDMGEHITVDDIWKKIDDTFPTFQEEKTCNEYGLEIDGDIIIQYKKLKSGKKESIARLKKSSFKRYVTDVKKARKNIK